eukprot:s1365_g2.t1
MCGGCEGREVKPVVQRVTTSKPSVQIITQPGPSPPRVGQGLYGILIAPDLRPLRRRGLGWRLCPLTSW